MSIFSKIFNVGDRRLPVSIEHHYDDSAVPMTVSAAVRISTVFACIRVISEDVGTLPVHVKSRGKVVSAPLYGHPVARLLAEPNPYMTGIDFRRALIASLEAHGNGYAYISQRDKRGYPTRLDLVDASTVSVSKGNNDLFYDLGELGINGVPSRDVVHIKGFSFDGVVGKSPISYQRETLDNAAAMTNYSKSLFRRDGRHAVVFKTQKIMKEDAFERLRKQLTVAWNKLRNGGTPLVLEDGTDIATVSISPEDAQYVSTKLLTIDEVAAIFRVPPHKVGDSKSGNYSNNTQANLEYFTNCVRPLLEEIEAEFNRKLFLEDEKETHYIDIEFKGLMRTATKEQMEIYRQMFNIGVYTPNEIRAFEDLPPYKGGDQYFVPVNLAANNKRQNNE